MSKLNFYPKFCPQKQLKQNFKNRLMPLETASRNHPWDRLMEIFNV